MGKSLLLTQKFHIPLPPNSPTFIFQVHNTLHSALLIHMHEIPWRCSVTSRKRRVHFLLHPSFDTEQLKKYSGCCLVEQDTPWDDGKGEEVLDNAVATEFPTIKINAICSFRRWSCCSTWEFILDFLFNGLKLEIIAVTFGQPQQLGRGCHQCYSGWK